MATATTSGIVPRLVQLFAQAGLINEAERANYLKRHSKHKSIVDVMRREVTVSSFRELLSSEIPLPGRGKKESPIGQQLNIVADVREGELVAMLKIRQPPLDPVIRRLEESGVVRRGDLQAGVKEAEEAGTDVYTHLVRQGLLSPAVLGRFFNAPKNPIAQYCSLFLCLFTLEYDGVISSDDFKGLLERIPKGTLEETLGEVRRTVTSNSKQLLAKIEAGLRLQDVALDETELNDELVNSFPSELIRRKLFLPLYETDRVIGVATSDPLNFNLAVIIRWITGKWMRPYFAPSGEIIDQINAHFGGTREPIPSSGPASEVPAASTSGAGTAQVASRSQNGPGPAAPEKTKKKSKSKATSRPSRSKKVETTVAPALRLPKELPVDSQSAVQLVTSLIESAIDLKSTDIHLEPARESMAVRFRLDGNLKKIMEVPAALIGPVTSRIKVLASMDVTERRRPQDGHIMLEMADRHFDLRVASLPTVFGEKLAIRVLDSSRVMTGLADVGFNQKQLDSVTRMSTKPHGIILVTGPTGSGKTSTLYAALNELNDEVHNLITIEDPVEYQLNGINQVQVDTNIGVTFSEGLRAILRQDPNIIMVGEIRDPDTAATAIRAALTGHLVFSTLHTNSAIGAIQALRNLGCSSYMIGSGLTGIVAQRLVRRLCPHCSKKKPVTKALASQLGVTYSSKLRFARAVGCDACLNTGYNGRVGLFEVIELTEPLRLAVLNDESPERLLEIADAEGRQSMRADGLAKVKEGVTTPEEIVDKVLLEG